MRGWGASLNAAGAVPCPSAPRGRLAAVLMAGLMAGAWTAGAEAAAGNRTFNALPVLFYAPETGFGGGVGLLITTRDADAGPQDRPDTYGVFAVYTEKNQVIASLSPERYLAGGRWKLALNATYRKFPSTLYGLGPDTPEQAAEDYTPESGDVEGLVQRRVGAHLLAGLFGAGHHTAIVEREAGGIVDRRADAGREEGRLVGFGPLITWDTRDNIYAPWSGSLHQVSAVFYNPGFGSDFTLDTRAIDLRRYLGFRAGHVLALQAVGRKAGGEVPLRSYSTLGGYVRGIVEGRYQDRWLAAAQVEYRFPLYRRMRGGAFLAGGAVAGTARGFTLAAAHAAAGAGVRYALNPRERLYLRADAGYSEEGLQVYFQFGEAF